MSKSQKKLSEKKEKPRVHTTISEETDELINKYAKLKDSEGNEIYGNKSQVIEKGIELLDRFHNPVKEEIKNLIIRAKDEINMMLIGKWTFLTLIEGNPRETVNENLAVDIIEWYKQTLITKIPLNELLTAIKDLWVAFNYFKKIRIHRGNKGNYQMTFYHDFHQRTYSEYWGDYFSHFIMVHKGCNVEYFVRRTALVLNIIQPKNVP